MGRRDCCIIHKSVAAIWWPFGSSAQTANSIWVSCEAMQDKALGGKNQKCEQLGLDVIHLMTLPTPW